MVSDKNRWQPLKPGDTVDIVAPGFACDPDALKGALELLAKWGLEPRVSREIFPKKSKMDILCSNTDEIRLMQLKEALRAEDSRAVWCLRGGYGSLRLIPELARIKRPAGQPKLFIGLSDISTIHVYLNQTWNWPTVHGPLLDRLGKGLVRPKYLRELKDLVMGGSREITFERLKPLNEAARRAAIVRGPVSGGNLVTLQSSLGTKAEWMTDGQILFFEEIGERGYKIDRILEHFRQIGKFKKARAIVLGDFTGGLEADGKSRVPAVLKRFAEQLDIPVVSGLQSGHAVIQRPVPFYTPAELQLSRSGFATLKCETGSSDAGRRS